MKSAKKYLIYLLLFSTVLPSVAAGWLDILNTKVGRQESGEQRKIFVAGGVEERQHELKQLQEGLALLKKSEKDFSAEIQEDLGKVNKNIATVKEKLKKELSQQESDFNNKKLTILNEAYQTIIDIQLSYKDLIATIEQHMQYLKVYLEDPTYKTAHVERKSFYTFEDLHNSGRKIADHEEKIAHLKEQRNNLSAELENRKMDATQSEQNYQEKKKEQAEFAAQATVAQKTETEKEIRQKGTILDFEETLLGQLKKLADLQVRVLKRKLAFTETNLFLEQSHLKMFKEDLNYVIKPSLRVNAADVLAAEKKFQERKQKSVELTKTYYQEITSLTAERDKLKDELEKLSKELEVPIGDRRSLDEWSIDPKTVKAYVGLSQIGYTNGRILLLDRRIDLKNANVSVENERLRYEDVLVNSIKTWQKISNDLFTADEELTQETKRYEASKADLERELSAFTDKRNAATSRLNIQNTALSNIRKEIEELDKQKDILFKGDSKSFNKCLTWMTDAQKMISAQIDLNGKLIEEYSSVMAVLNNSLKQLGGIISQLSTLSIWRRSVHAISWEGIKNIVPDLKMFAVEFNKITLSYVSQFDSAQLLQSLSKLPYSSLLILLLQFIALIIVFWLFRILFPVIYQRVMLVSPEMRTAHFLSRLIAVVLGFVYSRFLSIYFWTVLFLYVRLESALHTLPIILFYLLSIPYLLYLAHSFVDYFMRFNREHDYVLMSQTFSRRFAQVFAMFAYSSIVILLLREALLLLALVSYPSELPTILLALYSIVFRTLLIFLIGKEEILSVIPTHTKLWQWIWDKVNHFYYPLLIAIVILMIISDPYIGGYGNLVSYFVWGLIWTAFLVRMLFIAHLYAKKFSSYIFFIVKGDVHKDRFSQARTWYGIFVIILFVLAIFVGVLVGAWIWEHPISLKDIGSFFSKEMFHVGGVGLDRVSITLLSFLQLIAIILGGFGLSFAFNRFVFKRIFDLLLIDAGVQNTITSITRYLIIITSIIVGFQSVGLSNFLISIGVLIGAAAWLVQEPIRDFASYFILLVQRPIKIGDYIMLDSETQGIVRQITARSVILRRKNSYSLIVPNSQVTGRTISNLNYTRNFIAVDDITLAVPYTMNPKQVRDVLVRVLEANPDILKSPKAIIRLNEFVENGYVFLVRGFISAVNTLRKWDISSDIRFSIVTEFDKEDIELAAPVRIIKMMAPGGTFSGAKRE